MAFCEEFLFNASKLIDVKSIDVDFEYIQKLVKQALKTFTKTPVDVYVHGSYANHTNIFFPSNLEVCVELKIPQFEYDVTGEYYVTHELEYGPQQFRTDLYNALKEIIEKATSKPMVKEPQHTCELSGKTIVIPKHGVLKHAVEILPCISFTLGDDEGAEFKGVLVYDSEEKADIATFPKLHQKNGQLKDIQTEGNFKRFVRLFKTLKAISVRENEDDELLKHSCRGYFIECLLYNVPDSLFKGKDQNEIFLKIINYLAHANLDNFTCQNHVWQLFGDAGELWKERDARNFISSIKVFYRECPSNRINLA